MEFYCEVESYAVQLGDDIELIWMHNNADVVRIKG